MTIPGRLKAARAEIGLSQKEMAAQSGVSARGYQGYEDGRSLPGAEAIAGFVRLGINANWLLTGDGSMLLSGPQASIGAPDAARLRLAIEAAEEGLSAAGRVMGPDKKAELVLAIYDLFEEPAITKERVLKLVKFAA